MTGDGGLVITPQELKFKFELRKQIPTTLRLANNTDAPIAFKVKTTSPKKYCVRPNTGIVAANSTTEVHVIMQAQKDWPQDLVNCRDKFLVQSVAVPADSGEDILTQADLFTKASGREPAEVKLRVAYLTPTGPPSPVPEGAEDDGGYRATATVTSSTAHTPAPALGAALRGPAANGAAFPQHAELEHPSAAFSSPLGTAAAGGGASPVGAATAGMKAKYEATLSSLHITTAELQALKTERDKLQRENAVVMARLEQQERELTTSRAIAGAAAPAAKTSALVAGGASREGFTLMHLVLTAIIFFLLGYYLPTN